MAAYPLTPTQIAAAQTSLWRDIVPIVIGLTVGAVAFKIVWRFI